MSFNVSALSQYVNQEKKELLAKTVAGANDFQTGSVRLLSGIKGGSAEQVKFFSQTPTYQTGGCVPVSGTTTFTEKNVGTTLFTVHDAVCTDDVTAKLAKYIPQSAYSDIELPNEFIDDVLAQINRDLAIAAWQGGITTGNELFDGVNGWLNRLTTTYSASTYGVTGVTAFTTSNAVATVDALMAKVPTAIVNSNLILNMPAAYYNTLKVAFRNANLYNFGKNDSPDSFELPGYSNVTVRRSDGLAGATSMVLTVDDAGDLVWSVDMKSDSENIEIWYDQTDDKVHYRVKFAVGTEIAFPEQIGIVTVG